MRRSGDGHTSGAAFRPLPLAIAVVVLAAATSAPASAAPVGAATIAARQVADPIAMVVRVAGSVRVQRAGGATEAAGVGTKLMEGDRLLVGDGAQAVLLYLTGRRETVSASTTIRPPEVATRAGVFERTVSTLDAVASTDARQHPNRQGMIRPIAGAPVPVSPRNGIKVLDARPTFTWMAVPGAAGYTIQIRSEDGLTRRRFDAGADTVWTLPADQPPLVPGTDYLWTVAPRGSGRVASEVPFRTASAGDFTAIADGLGEMVSAGLDPWGDGLFVSALLFRDTGLFYEADRALRQLDSEGSAAGQPYYLLRGEVYDALGDLDAAALAFDKADRP